MSSRQQTFKRPVQPRSTGQRPASAASSVQSIAAVQPAAQLVQTVVPVVASLPPAPAPQPVRLRLPAIDMELPGEASPERFAALFNPKWRTARRWAFRSTAAAMVLVITMGGLLFSQSYLKAHKVFRGSAGTAAALKAEVKPELLKGEGAGRVNVLLLGRGGGSHDAPDLTDTMMLVSIDPVNSTSTIVSIPRDLWVSVPGGGAMKINAAWQTGVRNYLGSQVNNTTNQKAIQTGYKTVDQTVGSVLGITINYNVLLDFDAFKQAVDTVGGVSVNVPADLVDPTMAWENNNDPILAHAGQQNFDGKHALTYVRSRETSSDFARSQRQRAVMLALKQKVQTVGTLSNPAKLSGLLNAFGNNVSTDLSLNNAGRLYGILKKIPDSNTTSLGLGDEQNQLITTGNLNGQSIVLPKSGLFNFGDIQNFIHSQIKDPYIMREHAKVLVLNGTTAPGVASNVAAQLKAYGYSVSGAANTPNSGWSTTTLVNVTHKNKYTQNYLEQRFKVSSSDTLNDTSIPTNGADFVIIIGSDEATTISPQTATH